MKSKPREVLDLESELLRLNTLVRARREQLARLETCPHKDCECRQVWREVVDTNLSQQMGKIRRGVKTKSKPSARARSRSRKSS